MAELKGSSLIADAISAVESRARENAEAIAALKREQRFECREFKELPDRVFLVRGETVEVHPKVSSTRLHVVERLDDIPSAIEHARAAGGLSYGSSFLPSVWVGSQEIVVTFDEPEREDRAAMALRYTSAWAALKRLAEKPLGQGELVALLRTALYGLTPELLFAVRNVKFNFSQTGAGEVTSSRQSIDQSLLAEVTGAKDLPDTVEFATRVYQELPTECVVRFALTTNAQAQNFSFSPIGEGFRCEVEAREAAREALVELLPETIPVLLGSP